MSSSAAQWVCLHRRNAVGLCHVRREERSRFCKEKSIGVPDEEAHQDSYARRAVVLFLQL